MRDYALDLQARWPAAASGKSDLLLELLAFAEGRFLTVHPFRDFNGRTIRVFLLELLRRLDCGLARRGWAAPGREQIFVSSRKANRYPCGCPTPFEKLSGETPNQQA